MEIGAPALQAWPSFRSDPGAPRAAAACPTPSSARKGYLSSLFKSGFFGGDCPENIFLGRNNRPFKTGVANAEGRSRDNLNPIAPLQPESPSGQLLEQLLHSHPHLVPAAAEQQLQKLAKYHESLIASKLPSKTAPDIVLYRRIVELKIKETHKAVEEIIYALIVEKFVNAGIRMAPKLSSPSSQYWDWKSSPLQEKQLESVHTPDVLEVIQGHLNLALSDFSYFEANTSHVSQAHVGIVYAISIMHGYFLRRVDQRFQLEKTLTPPSSLDKDSKKQFDTVFDSEKESGQFWNVGKIIQSIILQDEVAHLADSLLGRDKAIQGSQSSTLSLKAYIMSYDPQMLGRCGTIRCKESLCVIENHIEALIGRLPKISILPDGSLALTSKDEILEMSFSGLKGLALEAIAFGSFLSDVESYVHLHYRFIAH